MGNTVALRAEGYVEVFIVGDQTAETFRDSYLQAQPFIRDLQEAGKPVLGLVDLSQKGHYSPGSNKAAMKYLEEMPYDRIAIVGPHDVLEEVTELIILAMGKKDITQIFDTREAALKWLFQDNAS